MSVPGWTRVKLARLGPPGDRPAGARPGPHHGTWQPATFVAYL